MINGYSLHTNCILLVFPNETTKTEGFYWDLEVLSNSGRWLLFVTKKLVLGVAFIRYLENILKRLKTLDCRILKLWGQYCAINYILRAFLWMKDEAHGSIAIRAASPQHWNIHKGESIWHSMLSWRAESFMNAFDM